MPDLEVFDFRFVATSARDPLVDPPGRLTRQLTAS